MDDVRLAKSRNKVVDYAYRDGNGHIGWIMYVWLSTWTPTRTPGLDQGNVLASHQQQLSFTSGCISRQERVEEIAVKPFVDTVGLFTVERQDEAGVPWQTVHTNESSHDAGQIPTAVGSLRRWIFRTSSKSHGSGTGIFWLWWTEPVNSCLSTYLLYSGTWRRWSILY